MKNIDLGKISVPIDQYASQGNAVLGIRGSGKSYSATYVAERLLDAGVPIVAFDPIGIWRFLRVPAKEGGHGYKVVVAGGEHADIPLPAHGAAEIMRAAMKDGVSIIFDLYDIGLSKGDWRRVVESAIKVLLYENKVHGLRHIFLEEAAEFAPQRIQPDQGAVYSAIERLARMGGNAQLGYTLINQRAEEVNKAVLELCDLLILHRQKGRNSLTALGKWLDVAQVKGKIAQEVPVLDNGEAYVWPAGDAQPIKTKIPAKRTFHPDRKAMQKAIAAEAKSADVSAFVETMKMSLERLTKEAEANDPKLLRAENARLRAELAKKVHVEMPRATGKATLHEAEQRGYERGRLEALKAGQHLITQAKRHASTALGNANTLVGHLADLEIKLQLAERAAHDAPRGPTRLSNVTSPRVGAGTAPSYRGNGSGEPNPSIGNSGLRRILIALAQRPQGLTQRALGVRAGLSSRSGTFATYLSKGRSEGWILGSGNQAIRITDAGLKALGSYEPLPEGRELLSYWLGELDGGAARILQALAEAYPRQLTRDEAAERASLSAASGTFATYLSKLRTLELIAGKGELVASEELFDG